MWASDGARDAERPHPAEPVPAASFGQAIYLSNDDTMSLSSAQRVLWAIDRYAPIPREHIRPHELLNYFSFDTNEVSPDHDFSVAPSAEFNVQEDGALTLALAVQGRPLTRDSRRNANIAYVIDRSGSMAAEGRMNYLKQGLLRSLQELKMGDVVHLTLFDDTACDLAQNFVVGRDPMDRLVHLVNMIQPEGSTNLHDGLRRGYEAVDRTYQPAYTNRVVLITDAITNTGITDESLISTVAKHYDDRKVRLSGVGVGSDFNDSLLDQLTERGKGAYVFLGSSAEVDAVFGSHFVSLIETIATDVHFRLHLPPSLGMKTFYGEEASTAKERVQAIHYFANTSQMFLSDLVTRDGVYPASDDIMVTVEYSDAESGRQKVEEFSFNLGQIRGRSPNLNKAVMVSHFARELQSLAVRPVPAGYGERVSGWADADARARCSVVQSELNQLGAALPGDPEARRVEGLWSKFCSRYAPPPAPVRPAPRPEPPQWREPNQPTRNNEFAPQERWPSAAQ
jgi:Ca-activated chloride channel family protein